MKKIYFSVFTLILSLVVNSQVDMKSVKAHIKKNHYTAKKSTKPVIYHNKAILQQYDFTNASDWTVGNASVPSVDWVIGTAAPVGSFSVGMGAITSTSGGNFALFDSDGLGDGTSVQNSWIQTTVPLNLSANPYISVEFESYYRNYQGFCYLETSVDGTNWVSYPVHDDLAVNMSTENPEFVVVNVSSSLANAATAYIRFRYEGGWDYAWMIDDVKIVETPDFDLKLGKVQWGSVGGSTDTLAYTMVPQNQISPVFFDGKVSNLGYTDQNDATFNVTSGVFNGASVPTVITNGTSAMLSTQSQLTVSNALGKNMLNFSVSSSATDANPINNTAPGDSIEVTTDVYARDHTLTFGTYGNQGVSYELGNIFDIFTTTQTDNISFKISSTTDAGSIVFVRLYGGAFNYYSQSDDYTIQASDLGNFITLKLNDVVDLIADSTYIVVVGTYGGVGTNDLVLATSGVSKAQTSFFFDGNDNTWYYVTSTPVVRLNTSLISGLEENQNVSSFSVSPNPAKENVSISYELKNETSVKVKITDLSGKEVFASNLGNQNATKHTFNVNTNSFSNGIYVVNFITNNGIVTEKLVVNK